MKLTVLIQPNAAKSEVIGLHDGALKIRIKSPPIDGKANEELIRFLSEILEIPKKQISIKAGQTGRKKRLEITAENEADLHKKLTTFLSR